MALYRLFRECDNFERIDHVLHGHICIQMRHEKRIYHYDVVLLQKLRIFECLDEIDICCYLEWIVSLCRKNFLIDGSRYTHALA